ncbi:HAD family hydrolase [Kitasatospora sp. NPDC091257]|uniref:HAD family hydrolase n=1 Tax=Kitasatospora sp. NPDC091257 TaxID=3364084 RepID=UPI0038139597
MAITAYSLSTVLWIAWPAPLGGPGRPLVHEPEPASPARVMVTAGTRSEHCIFIGDAARDVEAGEAAGVPTIGYANNPGGAPNSPAGAVVVVDSMQLVGGALH